jgi:hypothetical protein
MTASDPWIFAGHPLDAWKEASCSIAADGEKTPSPENLARTADEHRGHLLRWQEPDPPPAAWELNPIRLRVLRHLTLFAHCLTSGLAGEQLNLLRSFAYRWIGFLIAEGSSSRTFFLQHRRIKDPTFFTTGSLRPQHRPWPGGWTGKLAWLRHPERLTIVELEIALALFDWDAPRPRFVRWVRDYPHILWRVHDFLLKRYCFPLLGPLREAAEQAEASSPRFRAGEFWRWYPRVGGLCALGLLGLVSLGPAQTVLFAAPWPVAAVLGASSAALLWLLVGIDICKQNRGVIQSWSHVTPRVWSLWFRSLAWALVLAGAFGACAGLLGSSRLDAGALHAFGSAPLSNLLIPEVPPVAFLPRFTRFAGGLLAMASSAALLGALLQWFWEDRAMTETI